MSFITPRFLLRAGAIAAVATSVLAAVPSSHRAALDPSRDPATGLTREASLSLVHDAWLDALTGKHRQLFDFPETKGGIPLVHMYHFYETYNKAYGAADADVNAIGTFYGGTTLYGLNDAMWRRYRLGEFLETNDPTTGKPAVVNPWRTAPVALGMTLPQASIESLQKRGATFLLCNNALTIFAGMVAQARGLQADAVYNDMKLNILPGVTLVPGMVIAIEKAHERGIAYHRQ